ncbi:MAG TPA: efflux RND transporter periplasmic adaptor subunit [Stellaceae bacterium]|nr:efflux RND transporter periplasmic adaptor subunit [Stellaceae bacterium]
MLAAGSAAAQTPSPPPVTVAKPLQREITDWNEYTGQFTATESVEIRARVSGYLTEIHFEDGQFVKKGDLLFVIDPRPFQIALDSAKAQVEQATAKLDLANRQLARAAELRQRDNIPASTYDERVQDVQEGKAELDAAHAAVASAELDLEFSHITAPMSGHVSRHEVSLGNLVFGGTSGTTTLLTTIVATDPIYCTFDISEADLLAYQHAAASGELKEGAGGLAIEGRLIDEKTWTLKGRLNFVENEVDRGSGTLRARAVFPNPDSRILAGQFGRLRVPASAPHQALLVPDAAILSDQSQKLLMVVRDDGTVEPHRVTLGALFDTLRVITSGITPNDRVIINGLLRAHPGGKVAPQDGKIEMSSVAE